MERERERETGEGGGRGREGEEREEERGRGGRESKCCTFYNSALPNSPTWLGDVHRPELQSDTRSLAALPEPEGLEEEAPLYYSASHSCASF